VRFICRAILATGVLAFECARNSLTSAFVYGRRPTLFTRFAIVALDFCGAGLLTRKMILASYLEDRNELAQSDAPLILANQRWAMVRKPLQGLYPTRRLLLESNL
jgi:hypothetical protein